MQKAIHMSQEAGEDLIKGIQSGNSKAFVRLYDDYFFSITYYTNGITGNWFEAENIAADTFEKVWLMRANFARFPDLMAFIYVTCRNSAYNYLRTTHHKNKKELFAGDLPMLSLEDLAADELDEETERAIVEVELLRKLHAEISLLTPKRRQILELYIQGLDMAQIAAEMGLSEEAVRNAKFKALKRLQKKLKDHPILLLVI
ncbi:sigma-70 family RNA polymerase sigma factor [Paraflavitalea soli]|uniref:Sigma-70 family RNA polymerase sigma factor n=1 Tax=Paraflavitalea soli TaxID=2315862 RepID=A0A3B7MGD5_9BACT|nr:sigma-70 family RNA polymerase sigma factor [Paraflavitalea soli]AXY72657.1 sigma-70 family RNA polymerase sigma factor [Paraflavitalea soli]